MANTQGALSRPLKSEIIWVPCAEQLPDDDITVLVHAPNDFDPVFVAYHDSGTWRDQNGTEYDNDYITHWMSFPDPPEVEL
jgi:hypothetical protein